MYYYPIDTTSGTVLTKLGNKDVFTSIYREQEKKPKKDDILTKQISRQNKILVSQYCF